MGGNALSVISTLTMQNSLGIQDFYDIPAEIIERQIEAIADDIPPYVIKIGLFRSRYTLDAIIRCLHKYKPVWVLFSPVVTSSNNDLLMNEELIYKVQEELIPLCSALVIKRRDCEHFHCDKTIVADDSHGQCNELCSTIALLLSQGMSIDEAEKKARYMMPSIENTELSSRCLGLYHDFVAMQEDECKNSNDVNYYAAKLNVSARYLSQITKKVVNQSPKGIIDSTLLCRIKELLQTCKTIQEIAYELEFSSQAHLTNFFKRFTGITPSEYRKIAYL